MKLHLFWICLMFNHLIHTHTTHSFCFRICRDLPLLEMGLDNSREAIITSYKRRKLKHPAISSYCVKEDLLLCW